MAGIDQADLLNNIEFFEYKWKIDVKNVTCKAKN